MKKILQKASLTLSLALGLSLSVWGQNKISGTILDTNGEPAIGVSVILDGTSTGVVTDMDGKFTITAPSDGVLVISSIGYKGISVPVNNRTTLSITIEEDALELGEVTVVAYGTKRKQDLVGSVSTIKSEIIGNSQVASVSNALEGAVAGLQVISASGQPGDDASIVVRGVGSLSASNSALIIVDGTPYNGKLSDINPADIASISVSKDAVSNSLYGSRAAGGVVLVTTKTGRNDKTAVNFSATLGVSQRAYKDYDMVTDPGEFYRLTWYGIRNTYWASYGDAYPLDTYNEIASAYLLDELGNYNAFIIPEGEYLVTPDGQLNANAKLRYNDTFADAMFRNSVKNTTSLLRVDRIALTTMCQ